MQGCCLPPTSAVSLYSDIVFVFFTESRRSCASGHHFVALPCTRLCALSTPPDPARASFEISFGLTWSGVALSVSALMVVPREAALGTTSRSILWIDDARQGSIIVCLYYVEHSNDVVFVPDVLFGTASDFHDDVHNHWSTTLWEAREAHSGFLACVQSRVSNLTL